MEWILEAFSWVLLGFLVERLISLIICVSEEDSKSGSIEQERTRQSATVDHCDDDDEEGGEEEKGEEFGEEFVDRIEEEEVRIVRFEEMFGGKLASVVERECHESRDDCVSGSILEERIELDDDNEHVEEGFQQEQSVEFVDQANESIKFRKVDFDVLPSELNFVGSTEEEKVVIGGGFIQDSIEGFDDCDKEGEGKEEVKNIEGEKGEIFGKVLLVEQIEEEEEKIVGFEYKFGGKLEIGKNVVVVDDTKDRNLGLKERDCDESNVILAGIVDDERKGENSRNVDEGEISGRELNKNKGILSDDDEDWEGIERSELERRFAVAMNLMDEEPKLLKGGNDVIMQLYGLRKIAMEGPCLEPQPMALKISARAKWNAWKRLGNMSPEDAMEQYITLISDNSLEGVKDDKSSAEIIETSSSGAAVDSNPGPN